MAQNSEWKTVKYRETWRGNGYGIPLKSCRIPRSLYLRGLNRITLTYIINRRKKYRFSNAEYTRLFDQIIPYDCVDTMFFDRITTKIDELVSENVDMDEIIGLIKKDCLYIECRYGHELSEKIIEAMRYGYRIDDNDRIDKYEIILKRITYPIWTDKNSTLFKFTKNRLFDPHLLKLIYSYFY